MESWTARSAPRGVGDNLEVACSDARGSRWKIGTATPELKTVHQTLDVFLFFHDVAVQELQKSESK